MKEITALVPLRYNDGTAVPDKEFREFEDKLLEIAGGYSIEANVIVKGFWRDKGTVYVDDNRRYIVAVRWWKRWRVRRLLKETGMRLDQYAMYWKVGEEAGIIKTGKKH